MGIGAECVFAERNMMSSGELNRFYSQKKEQTQDFIVEPFYEIARAEGIVGYYNGEFQYSKYGRLNNGI